MQTSLVPLLPFLGAALLPWATRIGRTACALATADATLAALALLLTTAPSVYGGAVIQERHEWVPRIGLSFSFFVDGLGLLFAAMILGVGLLVIGYTRFYLSPRDSMSRFYAYLLLFQGAMVGVVLSDNVLLLAIFWERTSLSSFLLIGFWRHLPDARQGARTALVVTGGGGLLLLGACRCWARSPGPTS